MSRNIGFAPSYSKRKADDDLPEGTIRIGAVAPDSEGNEMVARLIVQTAGMLREAGAPMVGLSDGAAVAMAQIFVKLGLHEMNQAEMDTLVSMLRGFEVAAIKCALVRSQSN